MYTASTAGSARTASYEPWLRAIPNCRATSAARSASREPMATISHSVERTIAGITLLTAIAAHPSTPNLTRSVMAAPS